MRSNSLFDFQNRPIRTKLLLLTAFVGTITLALSSSAFVTKDVITFKRSLGEELTSISKVIASTSVGSLLFDDKRAARELLSSFNVRANIFRATLFDSSLSNFASYGRSAEVGELRLSGMRADGCYFEEEYIAVFQSVVFEGSQIGTLVVEATLDPIMARVKQDIAIALIIFVCASALGWVITTKVNRIITKPIENLVEAMQEVKVSGKFDTRVQKTSSDELGSLADHFNDMIAEISSREQDKKTAELERRKLESRLQRARKLEAVGTLAGGIAHDFNNLLGIILGYNELAQRAAPEGSAQKTHLSHIHTAGSRARDLVSQILDFSRQTDKEISPVHIGEIVEEVVSDIRMTMNPNINLQMHIEERIGYVMADSTEVHRIVMNLCQNAHQALENDGGTLSVDLDTIEVGSDYADHNLVLKDRTYIRLTVQDTGCGIDKENLERIFEPFFTTKDVGKGTGLGLSLVRGSVMSMGGAISAHSVKDKGTTFFVYFPQTHIAKNQIYCYESSAPERGVGQRIMVVDDEELLVTMCSTMLGQLGYKVTSFTSSIDALKTFVSNLDAFDIIVTDQRMPNMTGVELTAEVHKLRPDIPIVLVTGYSEDVDSKSAANFGFKDYLPKPYTQSDLGVSLTKLLKDLKSSDAPSK